MGNTMVDLIKSRRSIRKFENRTVPSEIMHQIVECAMYAPSAGNQRAWEFIVITEKSILETISKQNPYSMMARDAGFAILVCGNMDNERHKGFWVQDCSAASENILLAAHSLGIGAVWTGIYPKTELIDKFKSLFALPEHVFPLGLIVAGYPGEKPSNQERFDEKKLHYNKW